MGRHTNATDSSLGCCLQQLQEEEADEEDAAAEAAAEEQRQAEMEEAAEDDDKTILHPQDIDAYWLQRRIAGAFTDIDADWSQKLAEDVLIALAVSALATLPATLLEVSILLLFPYFRMQA